MTVASTTVERPVPPAAPPRIDPAALDAVIAEQRARLADVQQDDGHWVFELEADATIPSEYILLRHFLGDPDPDSERTIAPYLRDRQGDHGGWPLFHDGAFNMSASVKAYYALKIAGDDPEAPHMRRAREAILAHGGAEQANVFTRIALALFGQVPWRAVPVMPIELMLLPGWFPVHLDKMSYWSRTVIVPLLILYALKPQARNPRNVHIAELFQTPPEKVRRWNRNPTGSAVGRFFLILDGALQRVDPWAFPKPMRRRAIDKAVTFVTERLNGEDGLGGIFPAMANAVMAFDALGYDREGEPYRTAWSAIEKLVTRRGEVTYAQPCLSPVWDTSLAAHTMLEAAEGPDEVAEAASIKPSLDWLKDRQITDVKGDWAIRRPDLRPGGWAFQYWNDAYPDVDDTAVVAMAMHRDGDPRYREAIDRAVEWIDGMQSKNGGWGAFDADNTHYHLNSIPFADHGALLDPPTADVSARCLSLLGQIGRTLDDPVVRRGIDYLKGDQEADGSWFGRWGVNYVYGTWSVLCALNAVGEDMSADYVRRAVDWLKERQQPDGGWGEDCATYWEEHRKEVKASTASQTAWAVLGLMAAGETESDAVQRGIAYLLNAPRDGARWEESLYTGGGFPRVFYLKYHGYPAYFPLWALSRYRTLMRRNDRQVRWGM